MTNPKITKWALKSIFYALALGIPMALITNSSEFFFLGVLIGWVIATIFTIFEMRLYKKENKTNHII